MATHLPRTILARSIAPLDDRPACRRRGAAAAAARSAPDGPGAGTRIRPVVRRHRLHDRPHGPLGGRRRFRSTCTSGWPPASRSPSAAARKSWTKFRRLCCWPCRCRRRRPTAQMVAVATFVTETVERRVTDRRGGPGVRRRPATRRSAGPRPSCLGPRTRFRRSARPSPRRSPCSRRPPNSNGSWPIFRPTC